MESRWNEAEARQFVERYAERGVGKDLAFRTYTSRLIGSEPRLVLHGGGNTSVKTAALDPLGTEIQVLHVKGSGCDLRTVEPWDHPALRLDRLLPLRRMASMSDGDMVNALCLNRLEAQAPSPSLESLLHAFLPHRFIDHTHADAVLSLVNQPDAESLLGQVFGRRVGIVPYIPPGFELAKAAAEVYDQDTTIIGLLLIHHGIFTFGPSAKASYELMIELVGEAEEYIAARRPAVRVPGLDELKQARSRFAEIAPELRGALANPRGEEDPGWQRFILDFRSSPEILAFLEREDLDALTQKGPATPDHVIRTKPVPLILHDTTKIRPCTEEFRCEYGAYFARMSATRGVERTELQPSPCVVLIPGVGLVGVGEDTRAARIAADVYEHTAGILCDANACGEYEPLERSRLFDLEYWPLEQAKLGAARSEPLGGQVAVVTGAASGIGAATARAFCAAGAHVVLWDIDKERLRDTRHTLPYPERSLLEAVNVTDREAVVRAVEQAVCHFGGVDILISNAGKAWSAAMDECPTELLNQSFSLNLFAHQYVASAVARVLKQQETGGVLLFNASKSSFNPGADFGPYTLPKTALIALMKQYAIELGPHGVRSNAVNADRIRTRLFDGGVLEARAQARNLSIDEYFKGNLLRQEVRAEDVAQAFLHLALSKKTSAAVLPVDGGNVAASPR